MTGMLTATAVEKRSSLAFIHEVLALQAEGKVALPVDPHEQRALPGIAIEQRIAVPPVSGWYGERAAIRHDDVPAQISLTSGTTGLPKAILLPHRALGDVTQRLIDVMDLDDSVREYVGVPVTFSFGFGRVRAVSAAGGAIFLPERGFRVDELADMLERGEVNALSAVPTLLRVALAQRARLARVGERLRWLEIGSQAMAAEEKQAIRELFPNARIIQHYGLTEASRTTFLDISAATPDALATVGRPNGKVEVRIDDTGRIAIRGPHVADGIVTEHGIVPLADADGWLTTQDLGSMTPAGLVYGGRADDLINIGGVKVGAERFEAGMLALLGPRRDVAIARGSDPLRGELIVVGHSGAASGQDHEAVRAAAAKVAAELGAGDGFALLPLDDIPRTETNKVRRGEISAAFAEARGAAAAERPLPLGKADIADPRTGVANLFVAVFGERARDNESASFHSIGGDSLHYVAMLTGLEELLPALPDDWDQLSIGTLAALAEEQAKAGLAPEAGRRQTPRNLDTVRGLACVLIVALHVVGVAATDGLKLPEGSPWHGVMNVLSLVRLPLFTALAGYLYAAMPATRFGMAEFMGRKARQLLIPLIFATLVFWSLRSVTYTLSDSLVLAFVNGYKHLWFIDALLLIFVFASLVDTRVRGRIVPWVIVLALIAGSWWLLPPVQILHFKLAMFLLPYFVIGILLFRLPAILDGNRFAWPALIVAAGLVAMLELPLFAPLVGGDPTGMIRWICGACWIVALLGLVPRIRALEWIAAYSFTIYLWHPAANGSVRNVAIAYGLHWTPLLFAIGLIVGVGLPIVLHKAMLRFPRISLLVIGR